MLPIETATGTWKTGSCLRHMTQRHFQLRNLIKDLMNVSLQVVLVILDKFSSASSLRLSFLPFPFILTTELLSRFYKDRTGDHLRLQLFQDLSGYHFL
jgi:hypothetical protein